MKKLLAILVALAMVGALIAILPASAEETVKLTWVQGCAASAPTDAAIVGEKLNELSKANVGVEVDIIYMTGDQVNTSIQAGEVYDMYFTCDWYNDYATRSFEGIFADITEKVQTVTPDLYATLSEDVWELAKVGGKIYAIPVAKDIFPEIYVMFDKDVFDPLGMEYPEVLDFNDLTPYLAAWKEADPSVYPIMLNKSPSGIDGIFDYLSRDAMIGFNYNLAGTEDATKVISILEDPEMVERFKSLHAWYEAGYINPDAAVLEADAIPTTQPKVEFGQGWNPGADAIWSASRQYPIALSRISGPYMSVSGVRGSMNAFSVTLEDDEARFDIALKYQEYVNTNKEYRDVLRYGVEGTHFNYNEDGTVTKTQQGNDNYAVWQFAQGSYVLSSVEKSTFDAVPADPEQWVKYFERGKSAIVAADMGFSFDPTNVSMQVSALLTIKDKWFGQIWTGTVDPEVAIPEALAEMEAAGLRDVIAECQAQLDAHLASLQ